MAEAPESEPVPSSSEGEVALDTKELDEPLTKKRKITDKEGSDKLEHRLGGILCCAVCLDLPQAAVYQCSNGHLMCAPCFTHLLADARLRDESATCPNCRVEISKTSASRNLAVEKTVSELPSECKYCTCVFPRHSLQHHEENTCEEREFKFSQIVVDTATKRRYLDSLVGIVTSVYLVLVGALRRSVLSPLAGDARAPLKRRRSRRCVPRSANVLVRPRRARCGRPRVHASLRRLTGCRYACIGCPWRGPAHEAGPHEGRCGAPSQSGADVLAALAERERRARDAGRVYSQVLDLLSYEKITFNDLQLKPYRTEEFVHKLYYETSRFSAFGHQWVVKAFVNKNQRDPTQSSQREISYQLALQLILKSKPASALGVQWLVLRGPYGEARVRPAVCAHSFREDCADAPPQPLPLLDDADTNRLLSNKAIHFRLIMFLASK